MRPSGPAPTWATAVNYPAGAFTYSGTPTKVDPGSGVKSAGYAPAAQPPAQWDNFLRNNLSLFASAYDNIDIQNWKIDTSSVNGGTSATFAAIAVDPANGSQWLIGAKSGTQSVWFSYDGVTWVDDTAHLPAASGPFNAIAFAPRSGSAGEWCAAGGAGHFVIRTENGAYSKTTTGVVTNNVNAILWDSVTVKFVLVGNSLGPVTAAWAVDSTTLALTSLTLNNFGAGTAAKFLAFGVGSPRYILLTANSRIWDTDVLTNTWVDRTTISAFPFSGTVIGFVWNPTTLSYLVVTTSNSYVSFDGLTWTAQGSSGLVGVPQANTLACRGGTWVVQTLVTFGGGTPASKFMLAYSIDNGANWQMMPSPDCAAGFGTGGGTVTNGSITQGPGGLTLVQGVNDMTPFISVCSTLKAR